MNYEEKRDKIHLDYIGLPFVIVVYKFIDWYSSLGMSSENVYLTENNKPSMILIMLRE